MLSLLHHIDNYKYYSVAQSVAFVCQVETVLPAYERASGMDYPIVYRNEYPKQIIDYKQITGSTDKNIKIWTEAVYALGSTIMTCSFSTITAPSAAPFGFLTYFLGV
jgi:hypothetical protein